MSNFLQVGINNGFRIAIGGSVGRISVNKCKCSNSKLVLVCTNTTKEKHQGYVRCLSCNSSIVAHISGSTDLELINYWNNKTKDNEN